MKTLLIIGALALTACGPDLPPPSPCKPYAWKQIENCQYASDPSGRIAAHVCPSGNGIWIGTLDAVLIQESVTYVSESGAKQAMMKELHCEIKEEAK